MTRSRLVDAVVLVVLGAASTVWCLSAGRSMGATFDEPLYMERGLDDWRNDTHEGLLREGTMPLPIDVATLAPYLHEQTLGHRLDPKIDMDAILPRARAASLVFWWILLAVAGGAGRALGGPNAGRLAMALVAVEPVLLGHAALATTDVAVTAALVALTFAFAAGRDFGPGRRVVVPGLLYGVALLCKASALVFGPVCLVAVEIDRRLRARLWEPGLVVPSPRDSIRDLVGVGLIGLAAAFVYCGTDAKPLPSFIRWAEELPDGPAASAMTWIAGNLTIFPNAGEGLVRQIRHAIRGHGHGSYLLGEVRDSFWYYFPAALSMKVGLPLLLFPVVVLAARPRALANWANAAALLLLFASVTSRVQIGVRFYLPLVALAAIGLAAATVRAAEAKGCAGRALLAVLVVAGLAWNAAAAIRIWPHGICHVNGLWGGAREGVRLLSDSNCDWGQGLPDLARWHRAHGTPPLGIWYFGTDPRLDTLPFEPVPFHQLPIRSAEDVLARVRGRHFAVSATLLHGTPLDDAHRIAARFFRTERPVDRTATFFLYDFTTPQEPGQIHFPEDEKMDLSRFFVFGQSALCPFSTGGG